MSEDECIPTVDEGPRMPALAMVREAYGVGVAAHPEQWEKFAPEFDRWLAAHDAQLLRDVADVLDHSSADVIRYLANIEARFGPTTGLDVVLWLRARADRIAAATEVKW